jgi:hypothetical protein
MQNSYLPVTPKRLDGIIRRKLGSVPEKSHEVFVLPLSEQPKLARLYEKYGLESAEASGKVREPPPEGTVGGLLLDPDRVV